MHLIKWGRVSPRQVRDNVDRTASCSPAILVQGIEPQGTRESTFAKAAFILIVALSCGVKESNAKSGVGAS